MPEESPSLSSVPTEGEGARSWEGTPRPERTAATSTGEPVGREAAEERGL